jgi:hypothetical protein
MHQVRRKAVIQKQFLGVIKAGFDDFPKYNMKILLGDFNAKVWRENIFYPTIGNESLHQDSIDNGVKIKYHIKKSICQEHDVPVPKHS